MTGVYDSGQWQGTADWEAYPNDNVDAQSYTITIPCGYSKRQRILTICTAEHLPGISASDVSNHPWETQKRAAIMGYLVPYNAQALLLRTQDFQISSPECSVNAKRAKQILWHGVLGSQPLMDSIDHTWHWHLTVKPSQQQNKKSYHWT